MYPSTPIQNIPYIQFPSTPTIIENNRKTEHDEFPEFNIE